MLLTASQSDCLTASHSSLQKIAHFWAPEVLKLQIFVLPLTSCGTMFLNRDSAPVAAPAPLRLGT